MLSIINIPSRIINFLKSNVSPRETAAGVCLGMFLGFVPLNGPTALFLAVLFFVFKFNRISTLLVLPVFKLFYAAGISNLAEKTGEYLLIDTNNFENFWRGLSGLPIIAYLDINNTITIGGLALSLILIWPVYIIAKRASIAIFKSKYYEKLKNLKFIAAGKMISPLPEKKAVSVNIKGIVIVLAILLIFQLTFGLVISPMLGSFAIKKVNESSNAKIYLEKINIWPLTLSAHLKNLKIFNPDKPEERMVLIGSASVRISIWGLACKRIIISRVNLNNAEINLQGEPDGSFNIQKLTPKKPAGGITKPGISLWDFTKKNQDWFSRIYDFIKKHYSKESIEKIKAMRNAAKKTNKAVTELPKGKKVEFKSAGVNYIFQVKDFNIRNASVQLKAQDGNTIEITQANINIKDIRLSPESGAGINSFNMRGNIESAGAPSGNFRIVYSNVVSNAAQTARFTLNLKDINLNALRYIYESSLPVGLTGGLLNLDSKAVIINDTLDSENNFSLSKHHFSPKGKGDLSSGFMPMPLLCEALNGIEPVNLNFKISGTVEKPEFSGFQKSLLELVKPNLKNLKETIKKEGINLLGTVLEKKVTNGEKEGSSNTDSDTKKSIDSLKSIFGGGN